MTARWASPIYCAAAQPSIIHTETPAQAPPQHLHVPPKQPHATLSWAVEQENIPPAK